MISQRTVEINLAANAVLNFIAKLQQERGLNNEDLDLMIAKVALDIKSAKEIDLALQVHNLTARLQKLEEKGKEENDDTNN